MSIVFNFFPRKILYLSKKSRVTGLLKVVFIVVFVFISIAPRAQDFYVTNNLPNCTNCQESYNLVYDQYGKPISVFVDVSIYVSETCCYTDIFGECQLYYECGSWHYSYTDFYPVSDEDCGALFNGDLTWEPAPTFTSNTAGTYCVDQLINLSAPSKLQHLQRSQRSFFSFVAEFTASAVDCLLFVERS